jgi:hypothetical protein
MSQKQFFADGPVTDIAYANIMAAKNEFTKAARANCESLWDIFEPYADAEFLTEIRSNFNARYWEMYLSAYFISEGYTINCPKPGPDVGIVVDGLRIWFEATSPSRGADGSPDQVPELKFVAASEEPVVQDVPNEKIVLRYLNSISTKYFQQYQNWILKGIVSTNDAFILALNPASLGHDRSDTQPPRILQAAFTIGNPYAVIDSKTLNQVESGYLFRERIAKMSGAPVPTGVFFQDDYKGLSGLLCSRVDAANRPNAMGRDFQLVPNPNAKVALPQAFRLKGAYFRIDRTKDGYSATPEISD